MVIGEGDMEFQWHVLDLTCQPTAELENLFSSSESKADTKNEWVSLLESTPAVREVQN